MAERIERDDLLSNDAIKAILELAAALDKSNEALKELIVTAKKSNTEISGAKGTKDLADATRKAATNTTQLTEEQKKNIKIQNDLKRETEKLAFAKTKEYEALEKAKRATRDQQNEVKKAIGNTNLWGKALESFQFKFNALGNIAANVLSNMTSKVKQFLSEAVKMAATAEGVKNAFSKIADTNYLKGLQKATRGAVSDLALMKAAVQANNFKIPLEQLTVFLQFAGDRALQTGEDFDFLVDSIVKGLGRKSVLILDNLGLSVAEINEEVAKTGDFMTGAANVISREMAKAGEVVDTTATKIARMKTTWINFQTDVGTSLLVGNPLLEFYDRMNVLQESSLKWYEKLTLISGGTRDDYDNIAKGIEQKNEQEAREIAQMKEKRDLLLGAANGPEKEIKTIQTLTTEIENLEAERKITDVNNIARLTQINKTIEGLTAQIDKINELGKVDEEAIKQRIKLDEEYDEAYKQILKEEEAAHKEMLDAIFKNARDTREHLLDDERARLDEVIEGIWTEVDEQLKAEEVLAQIDEDKKQKDIDDAIELKETKIAATEAFLQATSGLLDLKAAKDQERMNKELMLAEGNEKKQDQIRKKYAREEQKRARQQAIINGALAVTNILANVPMSGLNPTAWIGIALAAVTTATQIGIINAQKFAKGTDHSPEGLAWVGEKGRELMIDPKGNIGMSPDRASLTYLQKGTKVIPNNITENLMSGMRPGSVTYSKQQNELIPYLKEIAGKPTTSVNIDSTGITVMTKSSTTMTKRMDKYFRA